MLDFRAEEHVGLAGDGEPPGLLLHIGCPPHFFLSFVLDLTEEHALFEGFAAPIEQLNLLAVFNLKHIFVLFFLFNVKRCKIIKCLIEVHLALKLICVFLLPSTNQV